MHAVPARARLVPILVALAVVAAVVVALVRSGALDPGVAVEPDARSEAPRAAAHDELVPVAVSERAAAQPDPVVAASPATDATPAGRERRKGNVTARLLGPDGPLRAGRVVLKRPFGSERITAAIDAESGQARFEGIPATNYAITLEELPYGWLVSRNAARDTRVHRGGREIQVEEGENVLDLSVEPGAALSGRVYDENGWPESEARVRIHSLETGERQVPSRDVEVANGVFQTGVHAGMSLIEIVNTRSPGKRVPPDLQRIELAIGDRADLEFRFERGTETFAGRIVDETGAPFAGLQVGISRRLPMPEVAGVRPSPGAVRQGLAGVKTDADGRFVLGGLPRGPCVLNIEEKAVGPFDRPSEATVARVQNPRTVELPLLEPWVIALERARPVRVHGRVVGAMKRDVWTIDVVLAAGDRRATERRQDFRLRRDDTFDLYVDGTEVGAVIEVKLPDRVVRVPLALAPGLGETFVEIPLP